MGLAGFSSNPTIRQITVGFEHAELARGLGGVHLDGRHGHIRCGGHVLLQHLLIIHFVNVVAGENENVIRLLAADRINVLIDGVRRPLIPVLRDAHLRRQHLDEVAVAHQRRPAAAHVAIQAERLVLRQHKHAAQVAVQAIGKRQIDNSVNAAERDGRFGAIARKRPKPLALAAGQQHSDCVAHKWHFRIAPQPFPARPAILAALVRGVQPDVFRAPKMSFRNRRLLVPNRSRAAPVMYNLCLDLGGSLR